MSDPFDDLAALPVPKPPAMSAALEAELEQLAPVATRRPMRQLAVLAVVSFAYAGALLAFRTIRADAGELPAWWLVGAAAAWLLGFIVPCYLALVPRAGSVSPRWTWAAASAVASSIGFITLGLGIHPHGEHSAYYGWARFTRGHTCLEFGLLTALVPVIIGAIFLRGALPVRSRWIAAGLGAGGGGLGGLYLHLHCPIADGLHLGFMHGGVVVVAAALAAVLVPRATDRPLA